MTDAVAFVRVEEEDLIRFGNRIIATEMSHVHSAIREHDVRRTRGFLIAARSAAARATDVPNGNERCFQQVAGDDLWHRLIVDLAPDDAKQPMLHDVRC
jgi:hypothetical protein